MKDTNLQVGGTKGQTQDRQPGIESEMDPRPVYEEKDYKGADKLKDKVALITGGDSGIGRAVAIAYAKEGAHVAVSYLDEEGDAEVVKEAVEKEGVKCTLHAGDVGDEDFCKRLIKDVVAEHGRIDILVNNAGEQHPQDGIENISTEQLHKTFQTNFFSMFYLTKGALPHMKEGSTIINTASINAYRGHATLIDYSSTKGAIVAFTRSMAQSLADKGIRVNGVAPGPIWTPLIPATFPKEQVEEFGLDTLMKRPGQPVEHVGSYVLLASDESSYMTGQFIHINGGAYISS